MVPTGTKLYQARSDHIAKQQWDHKPNKASAGPAAKPKETRNAARRRRNKKLAALVKAGAASSAEPTAAEPATAPPAKPPDEEDSGDSHPSSDWTDQNNTHPVETDLDATEHPSDAPDPPPVVTPESIAKMPTCGNAQTILAWATSVATIAEETLNKTFRSSLEATRSKTTGMAPGRRTKNGWYDGIEVDRKTVSQYDRMDFKMGRAGGWEVGMAYRARLVRLA